MDFPAHRYCYLNDAPLIVSIVSADLLIGTSYALIGLILYNLARRAGVGGWMLYAYGTFIGFCGLGHDIDVLTVWYGWYWVTATVRLATMLASVWACVATIVVYRRFVRLVAIT